MIQAKDIFKAFDNIKILNGITLDAGKGEMVAITGKSGAGKSTLLHILGTLEKPDQGSVLFDGKDLNKLSENQLSDFRNQSLGFIFQFHYLLPEFDALENVCIPAYINNISKKDAESRAKELLAALGLSHRLTHKPKELSGGEQQRVAFARALINNPQLVLADEPTGNLDEKTAEELHHLMLRFRDELNLTFIIVTHNPHLAALCNKVIHMEDGKIVQVTSPQGSLEQF